jgi:hypothetical protein
MEAVNDWDAKGKSDFTCRPPNVLSERSELCPRCDAHWAHVTRETFSPTFMLAIPERHVVTATRAGAQDYPCRHVAFHCLHKDTPYPAYSLETSRVIIHATAGLHSFVTKVTSDPGRTAMPLP